jgi:hypothetical protein
VPRHIEERASARLLFRLFEVYAELFDFVQQQLAADGLYDEADGDRKSVV